MDYIVVFNAGRDAAKAGEPRVAPATIQHPIVSRYEAYRKDTLNLSDHAKREWLAGFDRQIAALLAMAKVRGQ
jgi:hypothetical protein